MTYKTVPFNGLHIMVVEAGTIVTDLRSGGAVEITDESAARKGDIVYCTKAVFDALIGASNAIIEQETAPPDASGGSQS